MHIGTLQAQPGQKVFGSLEGPVTHGGFLAHIPLHIVCGANPGPTLVVQAGVSGLEIEPAMTLPYVVDELDPAQMAGAIVVVPLMNTSGFEFEQEKAAWDDKNLNALGRGDAAGSVSEQLIHRYYQEVIAQADALIDIHTGALWGYYRYAGVYNTGDVQASRELAVALGLPQVLMGQPEDASMAMEAAKDGKQVVSAWIGGGPGLRDFREEDSRRVRSAVYNAMRHLGILPDKPEYETGSISVLSTHTVLHAQDVAGETQDARGMIFMHKEKRGANINAGESIGYVRHPFTGETVRQIEAPKAGIMLHAGAAWPMVHDGALLAILGDEIEQVTQP